MDAFGTIETGVIDQSNMSNPNRKKWVILLVLFLFTLTVILGLILYFLSNKSRYPKFPEETGAILSEQEKIPSLDQFYALMEKTPVVHESFVLESDFVENKLIVTLASPTEESKQVFLDWLKTGGYGEIPEGKIQYQGKSN